eukprot:2389183-Ditylum_brightwellii.AAC.2
MKYKEGLLASTPEETKKKWESELLAKPLHGMFFEKQQAIPQVDWEQSWRSCTPIVKKKYTPCHDAVVKYIHWNILRDYGYKVSDQWWLHKPVKTIHVSDDVEVNWDKTKIVDHGAEVNRPDIIIIDKKNKIAKFVEISVP